MKTITEYIFNITDKEYVKLTLKERWKIAIGSPKYVMICIMLITFIIISI